MLTRARARAVAFLAAAGVLAACTSSVNPAPEATTPQGAAPQPAEVTVEDPWIKATDEMMTGAFGTIHNDTGRDLHAVSAASPLSARVELHEVLAQGTTPVMSEMPDGFLIPAGGSYTLEPGGPHVMLMGLTAPIEAGEDVELTLTFSDGSDVTWTAPARTYSGAGESYMGDGEATEAP